MTIPSRDPSPPDLVLRTCPRCEREAAVKEDGGGWVNWTCGACNLQFQDNWDGYEGDDAYQRAKEEPEEGE